MCNSGRHQRTLHARPHLPHRCPAPPFLQRYRGSMLRLPGASACRAWIPFARTFSQSPARVRRTSCHHVCQQSAAAAANVLQQRNEKPRRTPTRCPRSQPQPGHSGFHCHRRTLTHHPCDRKEDRHKNDFDKQWRIKRAQRQRYLTNPARIQ